MEASAPSTTTVVTPQRGWRWPNLREVWDYRDLLYFLARRDVVIRYKQAIVGASWAILQPLVLAGVFSLFLGTLLDMPSEKGIPYPVFAISGMVMWLCFTTALQQSSESTIQSEALISRIYFPRLVIPLAAIAPAIVDFVFGFIVAVVVSTAYGHPPGIEIVTVPLFLALAIATALGAGLWFAALNVRYRDIHLVVPLLILVGLFVSPVIAPSSLIPDHLQALYALNPMTGVLDGFRWALLGVGWPGAIILIPIATSIILLFSGVLFYTRAERTFADVI